MRKFKMKKRLLWCGFTFAVVLLILMISTESNIIQRIPFLDVMTVNDIRCYDEVSTTKSSLDFDSETNIDKPTSGRNIFFHETSCFGDEGLTLNARQACAIESAARMNPSMTVYLLFISKSEFSNSTREIVRHLLNYSNVRIRHIDPQKYVKETPLDAWYTSGVLKKSHWPVSHMSDILRYLTLWKYGGIYLDLDVVVTSSLENLTNFAGAEDWDDVAAGVMGFDMSKLGRRVADACVRDLRKNFRGDVWGNNGPGVITRTLQKLCATTLVANEHWTKSSAVMRKQRAFFVLCCLLGLMIIVCIFWEDLSMILITVISADHVSCYWYGSSGIMELGEGEWDEQMLIPSRCIFFHETTCSPPNLTPQQACAVESSARNNRNLNVFLLFFATEQFSEKSKRYIKILETYDNIYIRRIRLSTYIIDTPIEDWFWTNIRRLWENKDWLHKDFHDYVRMLTLWKFGGVSLNLNSVVLTSLDKLTTFTGVQNNRDMSVGVFGVDTSTNFGRNFVDACMEIIKSTNANSYLRYNITRVITEAVWKLCYQRNDKECRQFTIYSPEKFYPSFPDSREVHTNKTRAKEMLKIEKNAMTIHLLNNYNRSTEAWLSNVMAFKMAAEQNCPKIYKLVGKNFLNL
ncbi:A4GAT galactosyltransferase, partial [Acromyrmex charruanus]